MNLYDYQFAGVDRLLQGSCILADEMGLGKTVTALAAVQKGKHSQVTIVCPVAAISVWQEHLLLLPPPPYTNVSIVPYSRLATAPVSGSLLIVDEAHYVKNRQAQRTKAVKILSKKYRTVWLLTGTPAINHCGDYWSLLNICYQKDFRSYWKYVDIWCAYEWSPFGQAHKKILPGAREPERFANMLSRYVLRRTKEQVGLELPSITEIPVMLDMNPNQRKHHRQALRDIILEMAEKDWFIPNPAVAYTRARQIAIDPRLLGGNAGNKLPALYDLIEESGSRLIVFSEFVEFLKLANSESPGHVYHGGLDAKQRKALLDSWKSDPLMRPLYMSRAAGGLALTLTEAHTCVFLDEPWTPADREQAIARLHRIGQKMPVTVYSLRSKDSVEEHVIKLQGGKREAIAQVHRYLLTGNE